MASCGVWNRVRLAGFERLVLCGVRVAAEGRTAWIRESPHRRKRSPVVGCSTRQLTERGRREPADKVGSGKVAYGVVYPRISQSLTELERQRSPSVALQVDSRIGIPSRS
jgi:hypothetical protein